eukprot:Opistho-1_new@20993
MVRVSLVVRCARTSEAINRFCQYKQTPISIKQFTEFGRKPTMETSYQSCKFLHNELPIRLAHMTKEIDALPQNLLSMPSVQKVRSWYVQSFQELVSYPYKTPSQKADLYVADFTKLIKNVLKRHAPVVTTMAQGIIELKQTLGTTAIDPSVQYFLDRFYMSRIGIRMLIGQHVEVFGEGEGTKSPSAIGVIDEKCDVKAVVEDAAQNARFLCEQYYFHSPEVEIFTPRGKDCPIDPFPYVPGHLYHILFEIFKNSMRAVVEHHGPDAVRYPKVRVVLAKGEEDLTIKVSDEGGGIPRSGMSQIFTYLYTTATPPPIEGDASTDMNHAPLAGFGYGLPLSRLYARYFGGDLNLISMEGHGTDAYIYLKVVASEAGEVLPSYSRDTAQKYAQPNQFGDWMQRASARSYSTAGGPSHSPFYAHDHLFPSSVRARAAHMN